jgi:hypothetical protein
VVGIDKQSEQYSSLNRTSLEARFRQSSVNFPRQILRCQQILTDSKFRSIVLSLHALLAACEFDHVRLFQDPNLTSPIASVLIGDSPVNRNMSYNHPPNVQPQKGATIGTNAMLLGAPDTLQMTYPKIVVARRPHSMAIAQHITEAG